jgi:hypothetical protein
MRRGFESPVLSLAALLSLGVLDAHAADKADATAPAGWATTVDAGHSPMPVQATLPDTPAPVVVQRDTVPAVAVKQAGPQSPVTLRRMQPNTESMRVAPSHVDGNCRASPLSDDAPFAFTVDGQPVDPAQVRNAADSQRCVDVALNRADVQIRYDGLNSEPRLNVVAAPDAALRGEGVTFKTHTNYALRIERGEIRIFSKDKTTRQTPMAVIPVERGRATWHVPAEVRERIARASIKDVPAKGAPVIAAGPDPVKDGVVYVLRVYDASGRFDETAPKSLDIAHIRGGMASEATLMSVYNGNALEVRNIPITGGAILVSGRKVPAGHTVTVMGVPVPVDDKGDFATRQIVSPGSHDVEVVITDAKGQASVFQRSALIPDRDFFYVALADLTVGQNSGGSALALLNPEKADEYQDKIYVNGRLAFYLKGKVQGDTLVTAAADTREQPIRQIFSNFDSKDPRYLLRNLDPNKYYPVYGDDSTLQDDAPTRGKFYVRVDRGDSTIMWGNFKTKITGTEFVRYDRGLYGARAETKTAASTSFGERRGEVQVFAAEPGTLGARDVFRGTGGSLYYLRRSNITQGAERVTVEVRDKTTGLVLRTRTLVATQDYEINYLQGRISLNAPLASSASNDFIVQSGSLGSAEQYLVVNYEYAPGLTATTDKVAGGRASYWVNDYVQVGVTGYDQTAPGEMVKIIGTDITVRLTPGTYVKVEGARSNGPGSGESVSIDGGFSFDSRVTTGAPAWAKRIEAAADLSEIIRGAEGRLSAFWKDKDRDFSGPGELAIARSAREMGIRSVVKLGDRWSSKTKLDGRQDEFRMYTAGEQNVSYQFNDYWKGTIGARLDNNRVDAASASPILNQNGMRTDVAIRADYDSKRDWGTYAYGQVTAARTGERDANNRIGVGGNVRINERLTLSGEVSEGNGGFGGKVGTEYKIDEKRSSYLNYALDPDRTDIISRGGAGVLTSGTRERFTDSFSVFGEEKLRHGGGFSGLTHAFGVDFVPYEKWKAGIAFETGKLSDPISGDAQRTAVSASVGYAHAGLAFTGKYEYRHDNVTSLTAGSSERDVYLMNNALGLKMNPNWRYIGKFNGSYSTSSLSDFYRGDYLEAISAFAYRPVDNDRFNALFKYTFFYDLPSPSQAIANGAGSYAQKSQILSVDGAYDIHPLVTVGAKYAFRIGELKDNSGDGTWFDSQAHLLIGRVDLHVAKEWDLMGELRMLETSTTGERKSGALVGVYRHMNDNFKFGVGYNFTQFSDDLANTRLNNQGIFVNAIGKF